MKLAYLGRDAILQPSQLRLRAEAFRHGHFSKTWSLLGSLLNQAAHLSYLGYPRRDHNLENSAWMLQLHKHKSQEQSLDDSSETSSSCVPCSMTRPLSKTLANAQGFSHWRGGKPIDALHESTKPRARILVDRTTVDKRCLVAQSTMLRRCHKFLRCCANTSRPVWVSSAMMNVVLPLPVEAGCTTHCRDWKEHRCLA